jgi:hypothetical protein
MRSRFVRTLAIGAAGIALLAACGGGDDMAGEASDSATYEPAMSEEVASEDAYAYDQSVPASDVDAKDRDLIITMGIGLESADVSRTVAVIESAVTASGGLITSSEVGYSGDENAEGWATMILRIPPDRLDTFVDGLDAPATAATVTSVNRSTDDVTDQLVELDVRIENQRESVEAIRRLMVDATELADVVMLEYELNRRQTDLEIMLAQQASMTDRVELATVTVDVYHPGGGPEPDRGIIDGFADGWSAFVSAGSRVSYLLAAISPFLGVALVVGIGFIAIRRRR